MFSTTPRLALPPALLLATLLLSPGARGQEEGPGAEVERAVAQASFARVERLPGALLADERDRFLDARGWRLGAGGGPGGAWIGWGEASIGVGTDHPAWGKARLSAYEQALMRAKTDFVRFQRQEITTETLRRYGFDDSFHDPRAAIPADSEAALRTKIALLDEARLDRALQDEGVAVPRTFEEKRITYERVLTRVTTTRAVGHLAGLRPVSSFEAHDGEGGASIGVLVIASPELRRLAESVASRRGWSATSGAGSSTLAEQIPRRGDELQHEFGVRVLLDEHGERALVAFGQAAPSIERGATSATIERRREAAFEQAHNAAVAALAQFVDETVSFGSVSEFGEALEEYRAKVERGFEEEGALASFIDRSSEESRGRARLDARGIVRLRDWQANHSDTGHPLFGVVIAWSPSSVDAAQAAARLHGAASTQGRGPVQPPAAGVRTGRDWEPAASHTVCPKGVIRTGRGVTHQDAVSSALLEAVRSTQGLWIESDQQSTREFEELVRDLQVLVSSEDRSKQNLAQRTRGYIEAYHLLGERRDPTSGRWEVEACVVLAGFDPDDPRPLEAKKTIAVLPFRTARSSFDMDGARVDATEVVRRLQTSLTQQIVAIDQFRVLDRSFLEELEKEMELLTRRGAAASEFQKLGQKFGADYVLVGRLEDMALTSEREVIKLTGTVVTTRAAAVSVDWRLVNLATDQIQSDRPLRLSLDDSALRNLVAARAGALIHEPLIELAASRIFEDALGKAVPIRVAHVEDRSIFLNQTAPRLSPGTVLTVYALGAEVRDPVTHASLGRAEIEVARIRVVRTDARFAVAEVLQGSSGDAIRIGAICRQLAE